MKGVRALVGGAREVWGGGQSPQERGVPGGRPPGPALVLLAAADPAQPYGAALPWPERPGETPSSHRPGRKAGALVVLADGSLVLYVERGGKTLLSWTDDPELLRPSAAASPPPSATARWAGL